MKTGKFQPADAGQLSFYVALVDDRVKLATHAPTVGILICGSRNDHTVRYALGRTGSPVAVASYTYDSLPDTEKRALPPEDQLLTAFDGDNKAERKIDTSAIDELVTYLRVKYDGFCEAGDEVSTSEIAQQTLTRVETGDFVFSHINAIHGAVAVVPEEFDGLVVTSEYTVCRPNSDLSASVIWALVRSPEARAEMLLLATGIGRTRVRWSELKKLRLPVPGDKVRNRIDNAVKRAREAEDDMRRLRAEAHHTAATEMMLDSERSRSIIAAFKPPR